MDRVLTIEKLLEEREDYFEQQQNYYLRKLYRCLCCHDKQSVQKMLCAILKDCIDKKYTYLASGFINTVATILAQNYAKEGNTLLTIGMVVGLTNYSVFKTLEVYRVNKKLANELHDLVNALSQDVAVQRRLTEAQIYTIGYGALVLIVFYGLAGFLLYATWTEESYAQQAATWITAAYILANTFAHMLVNGLLSKFRNKIQSDHQQLSRQLSLQIGICYGDELKQDESTKKALEELLIEEPILTGLCMQKELSLLHTVHILDLCTRLNFVKYKQLQELDDAHLAALQNPSIYFLAKNRLISSACFLKLSQTKLERISSLQFDILTYFEPLEVKAARQWSRMFWQAYGQEKIALESERSFKIYSYVFKSISLQHNVFKKNTSVLRLVGYYLPLVEQCIDAQVPLNDIARYLSTLEKLDIRDSEQMNTADFTKEQLDALAAKSSNWAWALEKGRVTPEQILDFKNSNNLNYFNKLNKELLELYFSARIRPDVELIIDKLSTMINKEVEQLNKQFKTRATKAAKQQVINTWLGQQIFEINPQNISETVIELSLSNNP